MMIKGKLRRLTSRADAEEKVIMCANDGIM